GGDVAAGAGGFDVQVAEFGPDFDGGGEDGVPVAAGGDVAAEGVGPLFGLAHVPPSGLPAGAAQGVVDGDGEARGGGARIGGPVHRGAFSPAVPESTARTPKWVRSALHARQ